MRHRRRIWLLLTALAVPCAVLGILGYRLVRQDVELAERRSSEDRRRQVEQIQKDALNQLEQIKLRVAAGQDYPDLVVVRAEAPPAIAPDPEIERGEQAEFRDHDAARAVESYRRALANSAQPAQSAYARMLLARALFKAGNRTEADTQWQILLKTPPSVSDEHGIPFSLYAGARLNTVPPEILDHLSTLSTTALYLLMDLTRDPRVAQRAARNERLEPISQQLLALAGRYPLHDVWIPFNGDPVWLAGEGVNGILIAVPAPSVLSSLDAGGIELGGQLPGVKIRAPAVSPVTRSSSVVFVSFALALAGVVAALGGYLLWRDIQREAALANLQAQFVASVSHELKTPLTAIRMFAETLRLRAVGNPRLQEEYLDTIIHEGERLTRLVDNVLDFSKLERGNKHYRFEKVSLTDVIDSAARTMRYPLAQSGFQLAVHADGSVPPVRADRDSLEQAVLNLLTNAMKYSGDARDIALRLHREDDQAVIAIEDHGLGIPEADQGRIFDQFFRARTEHNRLIPGAGLGLTLAAQTAKAHSGTISVRSRPGEGSTFSIRIPLEGSTS